MGTTPPIIISRWHGPEEERRALEDSVIEELRRGAYDVLVVPHLYHLRPGGEAACRIRSSGAVAAAAWMHPRPARWTPAMRDVGTEIHFVDFREQTGAGECAASLATHAPPGPSPGRVDKVDGQVEERWYPLVERERCVACGRCYDFCLFGVYELEGDRPETVHPDNCKPGCPACARVCPEGAIMFPHYDADPAIAGAPGTRVQGGLIDLEQFFSESPPPREEGLCDCECDCESNQSGAPPCTEDACESGADCGCNTGEEPDELDGLIDALDNLDE